MCYLQFVYSWFPWTKLTRELVAATDWHYITAVKAPDRLAVFVQETTQTVYNWQFMHSVSLWTRMIGELHDDESIQSLIYPLTQTIIGTIKSVTLISTLGFHFTALN